MKKIGYLLFAFSFANANVYNYGPWIPGTESIFRFESKAPYDSLDGLGIKSNVHVQAFADHTLRIKFEGSEIVQKLNGTLDLPKDPKPNAALDLPMEAILQGAMDLQIEPTVAKDFIRYLEETMVAQLKQGHVKSFFVSRKEPKAVTDIKKSFLSHISLYLSDSSNTALKSTHTRWMIELLGKDAIAARLPLTNTKTREETSLVPTSYETTSPGLCCKMLEISSVGSVNKFGLFGLYVYHGTYDGRYAYKHVKKEYYLYRAVGWDSDYYGNIYTYDDWLVSGQVGRTTARIQHSSCTSETCPEDCDSTWQITKGDGWILDPKLVVKCLKGCVDDLDGYNGYDCSTYEDYCRDSYTGDWYNRFRAACKNTCSRYASAYCNAVECTGCVDEYLGYDNVTKLDGYDCNDYKKQCRSDYVSEWAQNVRASCKNTCSLFASDYCHLNTCKELSTTEKCCRNYNVPSECVPLCAPTDEVSVWSKGYDDNLLRYCARFWNEIDQCKKGSVCDENCKCQNGGSYDGGVAVNGNGYCEFHCSSSGYCGDSNSYKTLGSRDCTACGNPKITQRTKSPQNESNQTRQ